jgi:hypothetical protein
METSYNMAAYLGVFTEPDELQKSAEVYASAQVSVERI